MRQTFIISSDKIRSDVLGLIALAKWNTRVEIKEAKRTLPQNDRMHAMLTQIARKWTHEGVSLSKDDWKLLFLDQLGDELRLMRSLDGRRLVPLGRRSSDLTKEEMTGMIELIHKFAAENGIDLEEPADPATLKRQTEAA